MKTWLGDFQEKSYLNAYPVCLKTRSGIGYKVGSQTVSTFVGHPIHYKQGNEWLPITLENINGQFVGSDYGWNGYAVTHKKKVLYYPQSITFNGVVRALNFFLDADNNRVVAYVPGIGEYQIIYAEKGVREMLTIPEPLDGVLTFQADSAVKPQEIHKRARRVANVGVEMSGDTYNLTPDMSYPMVIDPDYTDQTGDGWVNGYNVTYATARSTSAAFDITDVIIQVGQTSAYRIYRGALKFDTSGIPDADIISQVNLSMAAAIDTSTDDFDVKITKYDWSANDPITAGNREAFYDGAIAATVETNQWRNTSGMSLDTQYVSGNLDTTWPSKTGNTFYGLLSSKDLASTVPTTNERISPHSQDALTAGYRPFLTVVHAAAASTRFGLATLGVGK